MILILFPLKFPFVAFQKKVIKSEIKIGDSWLTC